MANDLERVRKDISRYEDRCAEVEKELKETLTMELREKLESRLNLLLGNLVELRKVEVELRKEKNLKEAQDRSVEAAAAGPGPVSTAAGGAAAGPGPGSTAAAGVAASQGAGTEVEAGWLPTATVVLEWLEQLKLELGDIMSLQQEIREEIRVQSQFVRVLMQGKFTVTSSKDSTPYRENAFKYYGYSTSPKTVQCMVTRENMPAASIKAGHIFRQGWNRSYLPLLGVTSVHDPRNIILVRTEVQTAFDRFELAIIPQNENGVECYQIYVLKKSLLLNAREKFIGTGDAAKSDTKKWVDVHKKYLHMAGDNVPARRLLAFHAHHAIKYAVSAGWQEPGEVTVSQAGWASPGYDRVLMRKYLEGAVTLAGLLAATSEDNQSQ